MFLQNRALFDTIKEEAYNVRALFDTIKEEAYNVWRRL